MGAVCKPGYLQQPQEVEATEPQVYTAGLSLLVALGTSGAWVWLDLSPSLSQPGDNPVHASGFSPLVPFPSLGPSDLPPAQALVPSKLSSFFPKPGRGCRAPQARGAVAQNPDSTRRSRRLPWGRDDFLAQRGSFPQRQDARLALEGVIPRRTDGQEAAERDGSAREKLESPACFLLLAGALPGGCIQAPGPSTEEPLGECSCD